MNSFGEDIYSHPSSIRLGEVSQERPFPQSRIKLPEEDPFSLKVVEELERQGLTIRWRYGYKLANRYEVRRIHSGGMGIVWIVEDLLDGNKRYAAKSIKPYFSKPTTDPKWKRREDSIQRFLEECKIWVDLEKHRHIVYAEFLENIEGIPLFMSEYIAGGDLKGMIKNGPLDLPMALDFAIQFCLGMEYANNRGVIVHRDIKPGNIMVNEGILKINDFGLSKAIESAEGIRGEGIEESDSPFNIAQMSISRGMGTLPYMAPEQFPKRLLEHIWYPVYPLAIPTDIFAFGLVLYEMVKGMHAYEADKEKDRKLWNRAYKIASEISIRPTCVYYFLKSINLSLSLPISHYEPLDALILKCLKKNPAKRYMNFSELKAELIGIYQQVEQKEYQITEEAPQKPNLRNMAKTYWILGREEESMELYDKALEKIAGNTSIWLEKALALLETGRVKEFGICMVIIPYLRPSKEKVVSTYRDIILEKWKILPRDLRMLDNVAAQYPVLLEVKDYLFQHKKENSHKYFREINPHILMLLEDLMNKDGYVRKKAAETLGKLGDSTAIPALRKALRDKDMEVCQAAAEALGRFRDPSAIPDLMAALRDGDIKVRRSCLDALANFGDPSVIPACIDALKDKNPDVHKGAVELLQKIVSSSAIPDLMEAMGDGDENVRRGSAMVLGKLGDPLVISALREALRDKKKGVREDAVQALGEFRDPSAIQALKEALKDKDWSVREKAVESLENIGDLSAITVLIETLRDENQLVSNRAAEALGKIGGPSVIPALIEPLRDSYIRTINAKSMRLRDLSMSISDYREYIENAIRNEIRDELYIIKRRNSLVKALRYIFCKTDEKDLKRIKKELKDHSALAWNEKGLQFLGKNKSQKALKCFEKAIEIDPEWDEPRKNLKKCQTEE